MKRVRKNGDDLKEPSIAEAGKNGELVERSEPAGKTTNDAAVGELLETDDPLLQAPGAVRFWDYARLLKNPQTTVEQAAAWLQEHRCTSTPKDVRRHRKSFAHVLKNARQAAFVSASLVAAARDIGPTRIAEACVVLVEQKLLQAVYQRLSEPDRKELEPKAWRELLAAINLLLGNRIKVQSLRRTTGRKGKPGETARVGKMTTSEIAERFHTALLTTKASSVHTAKPA